MKYKAHSIDSEGKHHEDVIEAADMSVVIAEIKKKGFTLIGINEVSRNTSGIHLSFGSLFGRIKPIEKINFARNLSSMLDAGLAVSRALAVLEKQTKHKKFKAIINGLNKSISQGKTLSESMKEYGAVFPSLMISMVKAGEESGSLGVSLRGVSNQMDSNYKLTKKIKGAMMYPTIIMFAMIIMGFFMLTFVVPTLAATFKEFNSSLPISTQIVIGLSDFVKQHFIVTLVGALVLFFGGYFGLKTKAGQRGLDYVLLHIPIIKELTKQINSARTARTLSSLLTAGVDVVIATQITADVLQNSYYKEILTIVQERIQKGEAIAQVFMEREKLYPPFVGEMIAVGEETGQLAQMLLGVAVFYENEVDQKTKDMSTIIEPFLMIFIGLAVGFFAISMVSPIYSLSSSIN
jgi:type IV pilus assembly protein PilC